MFDAAGVLYRRAERTGAYVSRLLVERGLPPDLLAQAGIAHQALRSQAECGQIGPDEYWDHRLKLHGVAGPEERRALVARISTYSDQVLPIPGNVETLAALKKCGFVLGIVTDTIHPIGRKMRWLNQVGVAEFIDVVACSTVVGAHKPDPAIYLNALQQARLTPGQSAFVGHAADELEGARRAGLATVAVLYEPDARADYYAESLPDLLDVPIFAKPHMKGSEE
jgi:HAD superfamily hydrolase (TIGR01509 family)